MQDLSTWILERGEAIQVPLFFGCLALFILAQTLFPRRKLGGKRVARWRTNALLTASCIAVLPLVPLSFIAAAAWASSEGIGLLNQFALPTGVIVVATLGVRGFISTGTHWLNHKVPWLWRIHRVHHLDTELDVSSTVRMHPLEMLVGPVIGLPVVIAFGLSPWVLGAYELLDIVITLFSHSNLRIPQGLNRWLRYLIVTPELHRVHHSSWQPETDSNFGAVFPIWDIVLGTFRADPRDGHEHMQLGLAEYRGPDTQQFGRLLISPLTDPGVVPEEASSSAPAARVL